MDPKDIQWLLMEKYGGKTSPEFEADKARLALGEPVAYVIGWQPFLGLKIYLDSKPLIPRPETEYWVEMLIRELAPSFSFLDLCAGSGAIGCAMLKAFPKARVYFGEIGPAHEATIRKNIEANGLGMSRADIRIGDLFEPFGDIQFDVIAINPPYIPSARELPPSVAEYEPALALRSGEDGLDLMRRIAVEIPRHIAKGGTAWIECDSPSAKAAAALFAAQGFATKIVADQFGQPRVIVIS